MASTAHGAHFLPWRAVGPFVRGTVAACGRRFAVRTAVAAPEGAGRALVALGRGRWPFFVGVLGFSSIPLPAILISIGILFPMCCFSSKYYFLVLSIVVLECSTIVFLLQFLSFAIPFPLVVSWRHLSIVCPFPYALTQKLFSVDPPVASNAFLSH